MLRIMKYLKPYRLQVIIVLVLVFVQTIADLYLPNLMSDIVDKGIAQRNMNLIYSTGGLMLLVTLGGMAATIVASYISSKASMAFGRDIRGAVFSHVESFSLHEFDKLHTSSLITRSINDINQVQNVVMMALRMMVGAPIMAVGGIIMATSKNAELSKILLVAIPLLLLLVALVGFKGFPLFKKIQAKTDRLNQVLREQLTGMRVIRAFDMQEHESERFDTASIDYMSTSVKVGRIMSIMMPAMFLIMNFTTIAIVWFGGKGVDLGTLQVGDMMAFLQYAMQIMFSFLMVGMMFVFIPRASASAERINEVLMTKPEINDKSGTERGDLRADSSKRGHVEFNNVTFAYHNAEHPVLDGISFTANPGEVTAIIGGTGSGKSTLVQLLPRFYDVTAGSIKVDGVDVRDYAQNELRGKIGFVPQKAVLFTGTIEENIRYGNDNATVADIKEAAEIAQAIDFINEKEEGFATAIAQGGTNVSGGQKQRLCIARAIVRKPEVYIFDDSFSALDFKTDAKLRAALKQNISDATQIIVAQRVSTVMDADQIVVLDEGKVVGIGTHNDLYRNCEVYREIVASQMSEEELA